MSDQTKKTDEISTLKSTVTPAALRREESLLRWPSAATYGGAAYRIYPTSSKGTADCALEG